MATFETNYLGNLRTEARHILSDKTIITDAPPDNMGRGEAFSPTDLMSSSLVSCMITIMGISAEKNNYSIDGLKTKATKIMASNPRRVAEIQIEMYFPDINYTESEKNMIYNAAMNCPVAKSLHPDLLFFVKYFFKDETVELKSRN